MPSIKIIITPLGEAPLEVRRAWVGLVLPLPEGRYAKARSWGTSGVLSGPKTPLQRLLALLTFRYKIEKGYAVEAEQAVQILAAVNPEAARWWRENVPHLIEPGRKFLFSAGVCQLQEDGTGQKI